MHKNTFDLRNRILQYGDIPDRLKNVRDKIQKQIKQIEGSSDELR